MIDCEDPDCCEFPGCEDGIDLDGDGSAACDCDDGAASVWYQWVAPINPIPVTYTVNTFADLATGFDTVLLVFSGGPGVGDLTRVAWDDDAPGSLASELTFEVPAGGGTTYHIAVDGDRAEFGAVALAIDAVTTRLDPVAELLPARSNWEYLLAVDLNNQPIDPDSVDGDFDATWHTSASYDGPAFAGPAPGLLGYGSISAGDLVTDIWGGLDHDGDSIPDELPPSGDRLTTYYRSTFTPAEAVAHLGFEGLIDDGAIIYVNGQEVVRLNVAATANADSWSTRALGIDFYGGSSEASPQVGFALNRNLPAGQPVELAVSVHNASSESSDMGFDLRVWSVNPPPALTLSVSRTAQAGQFEIAWNSVLDGIYDVEFSASLDPANWTAVATGMSADPSGLNTVLHTPGTTIGFYRVTQTR